MSEEWRDIEGYEGHYQISDLGRVKSLKRGKEVVLRNGMSGDYLAVTLCLNGAQNRCLVHHLVAHTFNGKQPERTVIHHIDTNKLNNRADNLEYVTRLYNAIYEPQVLGRTSKAQKVTKDQVYEMLDLNKQGITPRELAERYGLSPYYVEQILRGVTWKHLEGRAFLTQKERPSKPNPIPVGVRRLLTKRFSGR